VLGKRAQYVENVEGAKASTLVLRDIAVCEPGLSFLSRAVSTAAPRTVMRAS